MNKNYHGVLSPNEIPDAFDAEGNKTINSWQLFKDDELARERYEEDED